MTRPSGRSASIDEVVTRSNGVGHHHVESIIPGDGRIVVEGFLNTFFRLGYHGEVKAGMGSAGLSGVFRLQAFVTDGGGDAFPAADEREPLCSGNKPGFFVVVQPLLGIGRYVFLRLKNQRADLDTGSTDERYARDDGDVSGIAAFLQGVPSRIFGCSGEAFRQ